ncbi:SDR family oxidoreductase [Sphaerisporangium perillae]|uniref:SDR family oxidoreductase n=1 Tax=Sphaerisporangium perillae TaxID=2935860 RepID=UPI00200CD31D|nr:SDR family oxidoreductase [Sphaerisporangium perillae]
MAEPLPDADPSLGLGGRVALVTGATRGLGLAIARKLCACGCQVILNYAHSEEDAKEAVHALSGLRGTAFPIKADVTARDEVARLLGAIRRRYGRLDVFVHNAASWKPMPATRPDVAALHRDVASALDPLLFAASAIDGLMGDDGRVIAVSSDGAHNVIPLYVSLGVAKAALESLVRYLAVELGPHGVTVNGVSTSKLDKGPGTPNPEMIRFLARRTPAGRLTTPEDVAAVVALLSTSEAAWINGQVINVDGGLGLRS